MKIKDKKRTVLRLVSSFIIISIFVTGGFFYHQEQEKEIALWNSKIWFAFSNDEKSFADEGWLSKEEIEAYKPIKDVYNCRVYYDSLNDDEKIVYNAFEYAFDNNYVYIYIDESIKFENGRTPMDILVFLSLDSPFVQQNLQSYEWDSGFDLSHIIMRKRVEKSITGTIINVDNFSESRTNKIDEAVEKAKTIKLGFPQNATEEEKARIIFKYIDDNIKYSEIFANSTIGTNNKRDKSKERTDHLYNAIVTGKTNCDGFSNVFSLLCNMNGLRCFEKNHYAPKDSDEPGHTWSTVLINGKWYNVDSTPPLEYETNEHREASLLVRFGFSDEMQTEKPEYEGIFPVSEDNIVPVVYNFESCSEKGVIAKIAEALGESEENCIIVSFETYDEDECDDLIYSVAQWMYSDMYYVIFPGTNNNMCYIKVS